MKPALIATVVLATLVYFAPRCYSQQNPSNAQKETNDQTALSGNQIHSDAETPASKSNSPHWYESPEWVLVIVGLVTAAVIGWQSYGTWQAAKAALLNAEAIITAERAWIMVDIAWEHLGDQAYAIGTEENPDKTGIAIAIICKNHGRTPGWITQQRVSFWLTDSPPKFPITVPNVGTDTVIWLGAGQEHKTGAEIEAEGRIADGKIAVIAGVIEYRDIFGKQRRSNFGYRIKPDLKLEPLTDMPEFGTQT